MPVRALPAALTPLLVALLLAACGQQAATPAAAGPSGAPLAPCPGLRPGAIDALLGASRGAPSGAQETDGALHTDGAPGALAKPSPDGCELLIALHDSTDAGGNGTARVTR